MLRSFTELTASNVASARIFEHPGNACQLLRELAGHDISDERFEKLLPLLIQGLTDTGDADRALANFSRWLARLGNRSSYVSLLIDNPTALHDLLTIFSVSQFFSDLLIKYPEHFEVIVNRNVRDVERNAEMFYRDASLRIAVAKTPGMKRDALRRFKPPEILRIGARDILGIVDTEQIATEISDFAEACVRAAVDISGAVRDFAVIALGKLGGRELNYASDIDLVFVHHDRLPQSRALELAEAVTDSLAKVNDAGFLFRVDLRLRPEGRFGPISRSLDSCRAYYESWAESWERQALLKARYVGGDNEVAEAFLNIVEPFVYRRIIDPSFVQSIRDNKRLIERKAQRDYEADRNVKEGFGGIRDVEFIVQLMQLTAGAARPEIRTGSTMEALRRLTSAGMLSETDRGNLGTSYLFLREVEHRLQIMDERPIRNIPLHDAADLQKFARRLCHKSADEFLREYRRHTQIANEALHRLFYEPYGEISHANSDADDILDWLKDIDSESSRIAILDYLSQLHFASPERALQSFQREIGDNRYGDAYPETRERLIALAPKLLAACASTTSPDDALKGIESMAATVPSPPAFFRTLEESPELLQRFALLAGDAPRLWKNVTQVPELLDRLADEELLERAEPLQYPNARHPSPITPLSVAAYLRRERLRIAALDLWGLATPEEVMRQISDLADQALLGALDFSLADQKSINTNIPLPALIALGKLGGQELSYGSDWDVLWIAPDSFRDDVSPVKAIAERTMEFLSTDVKAMGQAVEVDARLRPEGRFGTLTRTLADYTSYFETSADAWERQVLLKARVIGGDRELGQRFMREAEKIVYDNSPDESGLAEIRHLKERIEHERSKSPSDIKLGSGGLSDIEWVTQLLQWRHGKRWPKARTPNTLAALKALRDAAVLRQDDWETLSSTYVELYTLRNRLWLREVKESDTIANEIDGLPQRRQATRRVFERLFLEK